MFENPRRGRQAKTFTTTVPKILDQIVFRTDIFRKLPLGAPVLYFLYITSEVKQYHEALFLSYRPRTECSISQFAIQIALAQYSGRSKHVWAFSETVKKISKITYTASQFSLLTNAKVDCLNYD